MIVQVRDTGFRVTSVEIMIKQKCVCAGHTRSRLWESDPRPTHYEGHPHLPLPSLLATSQRIGSLDGAATASLDSSSRHNPRHDSAFNESWTSFSSDRGSQLARGFRPPAL